MQTESQKIAATKHWLQKTVIDFNFCPFAKREFVNNRVHFELVDDSNQAEQLHAIINECQRLDQNPEIETTLIILPVGLESFYDYLDLLELAESLLFDSDYEGIYQLASFHPDYCFEGVKYDDPANFTNRSPLPIIHILREKSLQAALAHYPDPENIPDRNIQLAREKGAQVFESILDECKQRSD